VTLGRHKDSMSNNMTDDVRKWTLIHLVLPALVAVLSAAAAIAAFIVADIHTGILAGPVAALLVALGLLVQSWRQSAHYVRSLTDDVSDAGFYAMHRVFAALDDDDPLLEAYPWLRDNREANSPAARALQAHFDRHPSGADKSIDTHSLEYDLAMAREFQHSLMNRPLPEVPAVHMEGRLRLEFHYCYKPAQAIGGDFFQVTPIDNDCAGVFIADVVGHSIRSALLTGVLRSLILQLQPSARNASFYMKEMNRQFAEILQPLPDPVFATAFYWVADTTSRIATYACAGHPPPYLLTRDRARVARLPIPTLKGAALGLLSDQEYPGETVRLVDGNTFVFFTDGVFECRNEEGEEFGFARLEKILNANLYKKSPEILGAVMQALAEFSGDIQQEDDICLVAVDVTTKRREG
jgi:serine phosphatase RsbU (regulator of sigma subunit)